MRILGREKTYLDVMRVALEKWGRDGRGVWIRGFSAMNLVL